MTSTLTSFPITHIINANQSHIETLTKELSRSYEELDKKNLNAFNYIEVLKKIKQVHNNLVALEKSYTSSQIKTDKTSFLILNELDKFKDHDGNLFKESPTKISDETPSYINIDFEKLELLLEYINNTANAVLNEYDAINNSNNTVISKQNHEYIEYIKEVDDLIERIKRFNKELKEKSTEYSNYMLTTSVEYFRRAINVCTQNYKGCFISDTCKKTNDLISIHNFHIENSENDNDISEVEINIITNSLSKTIEQVEQTPIKIVNPDILLDIKNLTGGNSSNLNIKKHISSNSTLNIKKYIGGNNNSNIKKYIGGSSQPDEYYKTILELIDKSSIVNTEILKFKNNCKKFNLEYVYMYYHILFITQFYNIVVQNKGYSIYKYIGKSIIDYYSTILGRINQDIKDRNKIGIYFLKYHYININILVNFFELLLGRWEGYDQICPPGSAQLKYQKGKNSKLDLDKLSSMTFNTTNIFKKSIFIFNAMKVFLDKYNSLYCPPVAIYLRINNFSKKSNNTYTTPIEIENTNIENNASTSSPIAINYEITNNKVVDKIFQNKDPSTYNTTKGKLLKLNNDMIESENKTNKKISEELDKIYFNNIFDDTDFESNETLANYMAIPAFLADGKPIMMITYGYSGVGKTFTVFGYSDPGHNEDKNQLGVLQNSLRTIENKESIHFRIFELYGLAFPYKSYWENSSIYHKIYSYNINQNFNVNNCNEISDLKNIDKYIKATLEIPTEPIYQTLTEDMIKHFDQIVSAVDNTRLETGRIKYTVNNVVSSRSIMIYDFKIKIKTTIVDSSANYVSFVIIDLPGKEDIYPSYVNIKDADTTESLSINETFLRLFPKNLLQIEKNKFFLDLKMRAFMNPLSLILFDEQNFIDIGNSNDNEIYPVNHIIYKISGNLNGILVNITSSGDEMPYSNIKSDEKINSITDDNTWFNLEYMRQIINTNDFETLKRIYYKIFNEKSVTISDKTYNNNNGVLAPFEGYYINENITGILTSIIKIIDKKNEDDVVSIQEEQFNKNSMITGYFDTNYITSKFSSKINTEILCQTYFFRSIHYSLAKTIKFYKLLLRAGEQPRIEDDTYGLSDKTNILGQNMTEWIKGKYDYNKVFNQTNPPIRTLLEPYFGQFCKIYLFYVINNGTPQSYQKQCKLITDSSKFIEVLNKIKPEKINEKC